MLVIVSQKSDKSRKWFDVYITESSSNVLDIPPGEVWFDSEKFMLPAFQPDVGDGPFRLWIEGTPGGNVDYLLDLTLEAKPVPVPGDESGLRIAWRDVGDPHISVLRTIPDA